MSCSVTQIDREPGLSWLCPTELDRARLVDMNQRVRPIRTFGSAVIGLVLLATAGALGWWTIAVYLPPAVFLQVMELWIRRSRRPERLIMIASGWSSLTIGAAGAMTGGATSPLLPWLVIPALLLATRFRLQVVVLGAGFAVTVAVAAAVAARLAGLPSAPAPDWVWLLSFGALLVNVVGVTAAMLSAELTNRGAALLDPLTGLLNRNALTGRFAELQAQAEHADSWTSVLLCDLDHFKAVNDRHGHDTGDLVLREVATLLRGALRAGEPCYRLGGEEFLVLLPDTPAKEAATVAERLRAAVAAGQPGGLRVTASIGVATARGRAAEQRTMLRAADTALYTAKARGRDQVVAASPLLAPFATDTPDRDGGSHHRRSRTSSPTG
jgi:diguanylate cyclase